MDLTKTGSLRLYARQRSDTFCDIRSRRGVRGSTYAFANSLRLQARLAATWHPLPVLATDLAPTKAVRDRQAAVDKATKIAKRKRTTLGEAFITAYRTECLASFDPHSLLDDLEEDARVVALFCVEKDPEACHRSLVADKLAKELKLEVEDIVP